jgi:arginine deiminase
LLRSLGIEVHLLKDHVYKNSDLLHRLPNLVYLCDTAVISSHGSIISKMSTRGRCHEEVVVGEALTNLGIPKLYEPLEGEAFEACLLLSPSTLFVADTERHSRKSIESFINFILGYFNEVIYVFIPQERRFMHADMFLGRMTEHLLVYYPPAFLKTFHITKEARIEIDLKEFMKKRNIEMIAVSDEE